MQIKIRATALQPDGAGTWAEVWVTVENGRITLSADALEPVDLLKGLSLTPADARILASALYEAAMLVDQKEREDFPP